MDRWKMNVPEGSIGMLPTDDHDRDLHALRHDALDLLYAFTCVAGFGLMLLGIQFAGHRSLGLLGIAVLLGSFATHRIVKQQHLIKVWLLVSIWFTVAIGFAFWWPEAPALCLVALPVALAELLVGPAAGGLVGAIVSIGVVSFAPWFPTTATPIGALVLLTLIWGTFFLIWLSIRPLESAVCWAWEHYDQAHRQLDQARDLQAELQQAVIDLADAGVQLARLNEQLASARRAAEDAERAKAEFVANVSHELRTPLNMIIGFAEMITDAAHTYGTRLPSALLADVAAIHRNGRHLASLINDVLDISQIEAQRMVLRRDWDSLAEIIQSAVLAVSPLFESRRLYLKVDAPADLPWVYCDRTRIRQVLLNLLNNAARATEQGGVLITARLDQDVVEVKVQDTGPGIAETDLPKLFEPFRQLGQSQARQSAGNGLGLSISRHFVELHGGQMGVESQVGVGSSFWFRLPVNRPDADPATIARWIPSGWEPRRHARIAPHLKVVPRVVVLEPEDVLHLSAERYLDGVTIEAGATPADVRRLLSVSPAQMVLIRAKTTRDAILWVDELHDLPTPTPIVACALSDPCENNLGVAGYLTKPVTRGQLLQAISKLERPIRSILLVDDDSDALQLFSRMLSNAPEHYRVLQASNGHEALELLRARRPDLLVMDLAMPGLDGFAVLAAKNKNPELKEIPVLILSARDPNGQPIVIPSFVATRSGGLSLPDLLRCALAISTTLGSPDPASSAIPVA